MPDPLRGFTVLLPDDHCPACGFEFDACTTLAPSAGDATPHPGDVSLCERCGAVLFFTMELHHQVLPPERVEALPVELLAQVRHGQKLLALRQARKAGPGAPLARREHHRAD